MRYFVATEKYNVFIEGIMKTNGRLLIKSSKVNGDENYLFRWEFNDLNWTPQEFNVQQNLEEGRILEIPAAEAVLIDGFGL